MDERFAMLARRVGAYAIDCALVLLALALVYGVLESNTGTKQRHSLPTAALVVLWISLPVFMVGYWAGFVGITGATPGQRILRLEVQCLEGATNAGLALRRCVAAVLAAAPCFVGYMWVLVDPEQRSWVDILTRSRIARRSVSSPQPASAVHASASAPTSASSDGQPASCETAASAPSVVPIDVARVDAVASALEACGEFRAAAVLGRVSATHRRDQAALARATWLLAEGGWTLDAMKQAGDMTRAGGRTPEVLASLAIGLAHHGSLEEACAMLEEARTHVSDAPVVRYAAVDVAAVRGDMSDACAQSRRLTERCPDWASAWRQRSLVARARGDDGDAVESAQRAVAIMPRSVVTRLVLADALAPRRHGLRMPSREYFQALVDILEVMPQNTPARQRLLGVFRDTQRRRRLIELRLLLGGVLALGLGGITGQVGIVIAGAMALVAWVAATLWRRRLRRDLPEAARTWIDRLIAPARVGGSDGRDNANRSKTTVESNATVLDHPARCWCNVVERLVGDAALNYVQLHLKPDGLPVIAGVYVFQCPDGLGTYVGANAGVADALGQAALMHVSPLHVEASEPYTPGGYL